MTANELADKLQNEKANTLLYVATVVDSANMLRQQETTIEYYYQMLRDKDVEIQQLQDQLNEFLVARDLAILRKAQEK